MFLLPNYYTRDRQRRRNRPAARESPAQRNQDARDERTKKQRHPTFGAAFPFVDSGAGGATLRPPTVGNGRGFPFPSGPRVVDRAYRYLPALHPGTRARITPPARAPWSYGKGDGCLGGRLSGPGAGVGGRDPRPSTPLACPSANKIGRGRWLRLVPTTPKQTRTSSWDDARRMSCFARSTCMQDEAEYPWNAQAHELRTCIMHAPSLFSILVHWSGPR